MAVITVQVGQCGNQLGERFFSTLMHDVSSKCDKLYEDSVLEQFFNVKDGAVPEARALLFDMENKVVNKVMSKALKSKSWRYPRNCQFVGTKGSGNNWAHGYCIGGPTSRDVIFDRIQSEVEKCDSLTGFVVPMSLAGGTGSGLGSFVTEKLHDFYPSNFIVNQVICPYGSGEVTLQNYNSILTLSHIYHHSDMIIMQENSNLLSVCQKRLNIKKPSFIDLNDVASNHFCNVVQPCQNLESSLGNLVKEVCAIPDLKIVSILSTPQESAHVRKFSSYSWDSLMKYLKQMLITRSYLDDGMDWNNSGLSNLKSLTNVLILRGKDQSSVFKQAKILRNDNLYSAKFSCVPHLSMWSNSRPYMNYDKVATLVNNGQLPLVVLNDMTQKSWNMYNCKAYIHQYYKYSLTDEEFTEAFATMEQIIHNYASIS